MSFLLRCVPVMSCEWVCQVVWLDVEAFDCCTCLYVCVASAVCNFLISAVWRKLTNKGCASSCVWDWVKREVKRLKCWNMLLVIRAWAVAELLSGLDVSRMAELWLLMMTDQVGQTRQQPPQKWNRYGRLSTRIVVIPYMISVQRMELVMDLVSEFSQNSWTCIGLQRFCAESVDPASERQLSSDLSETEGNCEKWSHTPLERHHRWWKHRLCLWPKDKTAIFAMEESWVSKTQKSTYAKKQTEDDAHLFLWPSGDRTSGICPTWNDGQCRLLLWCSKKVTWKCAAQEAIEMAKPEPHYPPRQCPGSQVL